MPSLRQKTDRPRGIVFGPGVSQPEGTPVRHLRFEPPPALREDVEHLWLVRWSLPAGQELESVTLPHPVVHWTVEGGRSEIGGVSQGRFVRRLVGSGRVVAVKFRPGGFCAFSRVPLHSLTDRTAPASHLLGPRVDAPLQGLDALSDEEAIARLAEVLGQLEVHSDAAAREARRIVEHVAADREATRVETVARHFGLSVLALQRLFRAKVGVSPKWVIQRYRVHEALERVVRAGSDGAPSASLATLAAELGFTDQAHFCRVFKRFVGEAPAAYAARVRQERGET